MTTNEIYRRLGVSEAVLAFGEGILAALQDRFAEIDRNAEINQAKVLAAMQKNRVNAANFAATTGYEHVCLLAGGGVYDLGDIGACAVGAVDARLQNLDAGACQRGFDAGKCCSQCSLATDDCDLGRSVFGQRAGQLVEAVLADGIVAHSDRAHGNLLSFDKVLSGILLLEKAHSREKFRTYKTSVEGFSPARNVLAYSA